MKTEPTQERLNELFEYKDGELYWKINIGRKIKAGKRAGNVMNTGYWKVCIGGIQHQEHRIIYIMHFGSIPEGFKIDHRNEIKDDNYIENLRLATNSQNLMNQGRYKNNKSGFKGVSFYPKSRKWQAQIKQEGKKIYLGYFSTAELASQAYQTAAKQYHGEFANY